MKGAMRFTQAPPFRYKVKGGAKVVDAYDQVNRAWSVGLVDSFYLGTRADDDASIVWVVDGIEYARDEYPRLLELLRELERAAGVAAISWGPTWCGYRGIVLEMSDGRTIERRYDGARGKVLELVDGAEVAAELVAVAS